MQSNIVKETPYNKINNIKSCFIIPSMFNKVNIIFIFLQDITKENNKNVENKYTKFIKVDDASIK